MSGTRRRFFQDAAVLGAGLFSLSETLRRRSRKACKQTTRRMRHSGAPRIPADGNAGRQRFAA